MSPAQKVQTTAFPDAQIYELATLENGYWWFEGRVAWAQEFIKKHLNVKRPTYVDIGCGTGGFAERISRFFDTEKTALVDSNPAALKLSGARPNCEVWIEDLERAIPFRWAPNLVSCMDVIEHLDDPRPLLRGAWEAAQSGGCLVISAPAFQFLFSDWDRKVGHRRRYTRTSLTKLLIETGWEPKEVRYMWSFMFPAGFYRRFRTLDNALFPKIPNWMNRLLTLGSQIEWSVNNFLPLPVGTSIISCAVKP